MEPFRTNATAVDATWRGTTIKLLVIWALALSAATIRGEIKDASHDGQIEVNNEARRLFFAKLDKIIDLLQQIDARVVRVETLTRSK